MIINFQLHRGAEGEYLTAPNLPLPHRFTTRTGKPAQEPVLARQIHSAEVLEVSGRSEYVCDGFLTRTPGLAVAVKTADCTPILLCDAEAGIAAAVHAGWRGTIAGIAPAAVEKMAALGADRRRIQAAIGPAICFACYQVGEDFRTAVENALGAEVCARFVRPTPDGLHADVPALNEFLLERCGVLPEHIARCPLCTYEDERFHSYRRERAYTGNQWAIITV